MRTIEQARANLEASIPLIATRYKQGVQNANWADPASSDAAEASWAAGVSAAAAAKRRQAGIRKVGNSVWQQAALTKGANVIGEQVRAGLNKYAQNFGRVMAAVAPVVAALPPRSPDAMQNINSRLIPVVKAMQAAKAQK